MTNKKPPRFIQVGWVVHWRELDSQGGYWPMTPKGPYPTLRHAREIAFKTQYPRSPFYLGSRNKSDLIRDVKIRLRVEVNIPWASTIREPNQPTRRGRLRSLLRRIETAVIYP